MFENLHKSLVSFAHTQPGILDLFSRDVGIVIANRLIVFADLDAILSRWRLMRSDSTFCLWLGRL